MNKCQICKDYCCIFEEKDKSFATLFTKEELEKIKSKGFYKNIFKPYKNSSKVFQIQLIKSKSSKLLVCPYLEEDSHLCKIYGLRPFECRFWPFVFVFDKKKEKILLACFNKDLCSITKQMDKAEFNKFLDNNLNKWITKYNIFEFIDKYPELIQDYEDYKSETFVIMEIKNKNIKKIKDIDYKNFKK